VLFTLNQADVVRKAEEIKEQRVATQAKRLATLRKNKPARKRVTATKRKEPTEAEWDEALGLATLMRDV
jgi:hypothetical protein